MCLLFALHYFYLFSIFVFPTACGFAFVVVMLLVSFGVLLLVGPWFFERVIEMVECILN